MWTTWRKNDSVFREKKQSKTKADKFYLSLLRLFFLPLYFFLICNILKHIYLPDVCWKTKFQKINPHERLCFFSRRYTQTSNNTNAWKRVITSVCCERPISPTATLVSSHESVSNHCSDIWNLLDSKRNSKYLGCFTGKKLRSTEAGDIFNITDIFHLCAQPDCLWFLQSRLQKSVQDCCMLCISRWRLVSLHYTPCEPEKGNKFYELFQIE